MHIHGGRGEVKMLLRNPPASIGDGSNMLRSAKPGNSDYTAYDGQITATAIDWIRDRGQRREQAEPWVLMVSLVAPHFPLTVPKRYFDLYRDRPLAMPKGWQPGIDLAAHLFVR